MKTMKTVPPVVVIFIVLLYVDSLSFVCGGCRDQERVECETVCHWNASSNQHDCNLRAVSSKKLIFRIGYTKSKSNCRS